MGRRLVLLASGVILVLILIGGIFILFTAPGVEAALPNQETKDVPASAPVRITFSRPMRAESVESQLAFTPSRDGEYAWEGNTLTFKPDQLWPKGETVTVTLRAGAQSALRSPLLQTQIWSFRVSRTLLAYLWPSEGPANLYTLDPVSGDTLQITDHDQGVSSFSVAPDGLSIYYSLIPTEEVGLIMLWDRFSGQSAQILDCPQASCEGLKVSPDGKYLAYERTPVDPSGEPGNTQVWLLPLIDGEPQSTSPPASHTPFWSPDNLLSFYDVGQNAYQNLDPVSGETTMIPNETGELGTWSPQGDHLVVSEVILIQDDDPQTPPLSSHLLRYNPRNLQKTDLTREDTLEDSNPVYSPAGNRLAFARRYLDEARWTPGRQLWVMETEAGGMLQLTDEPNFHHIGFAWHPNGEQIAYLRYNLTAMTDPPEIWLTDLGAEDPIRLVIDGYAPQWLP